LTTAPEPETPSPSDQPPPGPIDHPVRMRVTDDLRRTRLTVFFRLLLAIPHFIWLALWGVGVVLLAIVNWVATLVKGESPAGLHRMFAMYINYTAHVYAYVSIAANRFPGFLGEPGYEVDLDIDPPAQQSRVSVFFRLFLAIPALLLASVMVDFAGGGYSSSSGWSDGSSTTRAGFQAIGILSAAAIISWFYALFRERAPEGVARLAWYAIHYSAQAYAYLLLLTDRYPNSDPAVLGVPRPSPPHPIVLRQEEDTLERTRLTVFFRLLLALPHLVWLFLWSIAAIFAAIANWVATLVRGQSPAGLHGFLASYQRYAVHVQAFIALVANPFPGFTGAPGSYPVDVEIAPPGPQRRLWTAFRIFIAIPALLIQSGLNAALCAAAFLGWFASLFTGRMPRGLRNLGAFALRHGAQTGSFGYLLLTDRYPYAGPPA
jgi:uncharacterized protein DUF4389